MPRNIMIYTLLTSLNRFRGLFPFSDLAHWLLQKKPEKGSPYNNVTRPLLYTQFDCVIENLWFIFVLLLMMIIFHISNSADLY